MAYTLQPITPQKSPSNTTSIAPRTINRRRDIPSINTSSQPVKTTSSPSRPHITQKRVFAVRIALDALLEHLKETDPNGITARDCVAPALRASARLEDWIISREANTECNTDRGRPVPLISPRTAAWAHVIEAEVSSPMAKIALKELAAKSQIELEARLAAEAVAAAATQVAHAARDMAEEERQRTKAATEASWTVSRQAAAVRGQLEEQAITLQRMTERAQQEKQARVAEEQAAAGQAVQEATRLAEHMSALALTMDSQGAAGTCLEEPSPAASATLALEISVNKTSNVASCKTTEQLLEKHAIEPSPNIEQPSPPPPAITPPAAISPGLVHPRRLRPGAVHGGAQIPTTNRRRKSLSGSKNASEASAAGTSPSLEETDADFQEAEMREASVSPTVSLSSLSLSPQQGGETDEEQATMLPDIQPTDDYRERTQKLILFYLFDSLCQGKDQSSVLKADLLVKLSTSIAGKWQSELIQVVENRGPSIVERQHFVSLVELAQPENNTGRTEVLRQTDQVDDHYESELKDNNQCVGKLSDTTTRRHKRGSPTIPNHERLRVSGAPLSARSPGTPSPEHVRGAEWRERFTHAMDVETKPEFRRTRSDISPSPSEPLAQGSRKHKASSKLRRSQSCLSPRSVGKRHSRVSRPKEHRSRDLDDLLTPSPTPDLLSMAEVRRVQVGHNK